MKRLQNKLQKARARLALVGLPFDANSSFMRGPAQGPAALRELLYSEGHTMWTERGVNLAESGVMADGGDVNFPKPQDPMELIEAAASIVMETGMKPLFIGGDHSVTYPVMKSVRPYYPKLTIVQFDAHPDLYDILDDNRFSHACPFARIMEDGLANRMIMIGARDLDRHQREQAARFNVEMHEMKDLDGALKLDVEGPVYITFDMDALDPAFAPGVSHHEPGGLSTREALRILHGLSGEVIGADVVELNPMRDPQKITAAAAAKILKEIAGLMVD